MKKILFLHGFFASGQCIPALALREAFDGLAEVMTPDLPRHPKAAIGFIRELIDREKPDLLLGNSCGSFYAQMIAPKVGIPALLGNPHFQMTEFLKKRIGKHEYKSPRKDGIQEFVIDEALVKEFMASRSSSSMKLLLRSLPSWRPYNSTAAIPITMTVSGACLAKATHWPTLSRCFWSITIGRSIFPAITHRPPMKSATGMFPWPNRC